jgi:uncharacterized lipoprotein YmbA
MKGFLLSLTVTALCLTSSAEAAISIGPAGSGTLTFDTLPTVADGWSTVTNAGAGTDIQDAAALDAAVQNNVASAINLQLGSSATVSPSISANAIARWNSALQLIQTVPTTVAYVSLLATLRNDTGADQSALTLSYELGELSATNTTVVEEVPGHGVYWSLTGAANSWQVIPQFSSVGTPGTLLATLNLGSWPNGSSLYILWADDNANTNRDNANGEEGGYTIDNITFLPGNGAISVGPAGSGTLTFDTFPAAANGWTTLTNTGLSTDIQDAGALDATVQTNTASAITRQLGRSATVSPSISSSAIARWNSTLHAIETVATGVGYIPLLATLRNDTGANQSSLTLSYDLNELNAANTTVVEEVPGHRVYWSLTGAAQSWNGIPELSSVGTPGTLLATLNLGSWPNGSPLYILWADDNAAADRNNANTEEGGYTIDNVSFFFGGASFVRISSPTNGQTFAQGVPIPINASAFSASGTVTNVAFFENGNLIGNDDTPPFSVVYSNATLGVHNLTAVFTDNTGASLTSAPVQITVVPNNPPSVTLTEPVDGASFFVGVNVTNRASASDSDGNVVRVEFYVDGSLFFSDTTSPYSFELCDITAGPHTISAVAVDNGNFRGTNTISISAFNPLGIVPLVTNGSTWKYLDDGSDQGTAWRNLVFADSGWSNGVAELGYGDSAQNRPEKTVVSFGTNANAKFPTTYFRKTFTVPDPTRFDDGGIVYINGTEVFRSGITNETVDFATYTPPAVGDDGTVYQVTNINPSVLVAGPNIVAVEIHQDATNSSDISFDLMLWGEGPTLTITPISTTQVDVSWPFPSAGFLLESKTNLSAVTWDLATDPDVPAAGFHHVTVNTSNDKRFFRLRHP